MATPMRSKVGCFNTRQWSLFFPLAVQFFALATARTLFGLLFQSQLSAREMEPAFAGFVTGFNELAFLVIFPMSVYTVQSLGSRLMLHYGVFMVGLTFILMGFVENYAPAVVLLCLNFILWILAGIGASFAYMAALGLVIAAFPGKAAITYCGLFVFYGGGSVAGPLLGAVAADAGGFVLAYILVGFVVICVSYVVPCCLPQEQRPHPTDTPGELTAIFPSACLNVLKNLSLQVGCVVILSASLAFSFLHAALRPFLEQLELSPIEFGVTYSALHACALLAAVVVGLLCQRGAPPAVFTLTGLVCMIAGLYFVGPAVYMHLPMSVDDSKPEISSTTAPGYMGIVALGIGLASVLISVFASFVYAILEEAYIMTNVGFAHIAWIFTISYTTGAFVGSTFSGLLLAFIGLPHSTVLFIFPLALSLIAVIIHVCCGQPESNSGAYSKSATFGVTYGTVEMSGPFLRESNGSLVSFA